MGVSGLQPTHSDPRWLTETGPESDVVVSTRCRLARNLDGCPFPWRATEKQRREIALAILSAVDGSKAFGRGFRVSRDGLAADQIKRLIELRLSSSDWWQGGSARWLVACPDGVCSLLVNEEDHLRLQAIMPGLQVESCLSAANEVERQLSNRLEFARKEDIGFLTASLTNAGTGLRMSVMLHLPALSASEELPKILSAAAGLGSAVRGSYGEGSSATGAFYQVSNSQGCFVETYRIVARVRASAGYLVEAEREARRAQFSDEAGRQSLREATADVLRLLFSQEAGQSRLLGLVSMLRLAAAEGVLPIDLAECAAWIPIAGASPGAGRENSAETYQAIQRTATIRQRVRRALGSNGTFFTESAE